MHKFHPSFSYWLHVSAVFQVGSFDVSQLSREQCELVEADSFWCVSALLDSIHDNYTFAQPGIQRKVLQLKHLMSRVDRELVVSVWCEAERLYLYSFSDTTCFSMSKSE